MKLGTIVLAGISDNMTQLEPNKVDPYHYRVVFKPEVIIDMETSG